MVSQIKVNEIIKQSGSSIGIGETGDTISLTGNTINLGTTGNTVNIAGSAYAVAANTPSFMTQLSSNQSVSSGSFTKIVFNSEDWDTDSAFDTSTGRFTVPSGAAGKYTFYTSLAVDSMAADQNVYVAFYKNGSHAQSGNATPSVSTTISSSLSASFDLAVADYIEVYSLQSSGSSKNYIGNSSTECLFYGFKQIGV
mgnify:CR=1